MSRILLVEDKDSLREVLKKTLKSEGHLVDDTPSGRAAISMLNQKGYDLVLTDLRLPEADGHQILKATMEVDASIPVIVMTAYGTIEDAVLAMKEGAFDYISKPVDTDHLLLLIDRGIRQRNLLTENIILKEEFSEKLGFPKIVGEHEKIKDIEAEIKKIAPTDATVLLLGESGTGKELFARAVHFLSKRKNEPFVPINCAAIPETLLENELFGHEKGAYTGAHTSRMGRFEMAHRGTIFLDEIGDLAHNVQVKLLRVIETKKFEKIGGTRTVEVDVRIIAATNRNLKKSVEEGKFREDLYYRISVVPVLIPPLRERKSDIHLLARHFIEKFSREFRKKNLKLTDGALKTLESYHWPGNIRELENCMERAVILVEGDLIKIEHLNLPGQTLAEWCISKGIGWRNEARLAFEGFIASLKEKDLQEARDAGAGVAEKFKIFLALNDAQGDMKEASKILGLSETELYTKIIELGIDPLKPSLP
ncbi:MAG: sigma-54 dependent transcriptional regulator [Acidobacteriota bacterium]